MNFNAMLANGARFYIDHAHPEYSTPECASLRDLIAADVAGQVFLAGAAVQASAGLPVGRRFSLYRNNTDFQGSSYGCHENYQMTTATYTALFGNRQHRVFTFLIPFLVTRQIFCGAGKVGAESGEPTHYQISQRADFVETVIGLQTVWNRPIVNTRDEPHANPENHRRLHVIVGDANMSETATFLKVGVTRLVLNMLDADCLPFALALADPVKAIKAVSRDLTCKQPVILIEGNQNPVSALDVQRRYLEQARQFLDQHGATPEQESVWGAWRQALAGLESNSESLGRTLDWVIKQRFLEAQMTKRGLKWNNPVLKEMDVKYHAIVPERSIYHLLLQNDLVDRLVSDAEVNARLAAPPPDTRANLRCRLIHALEPKILAVSWDCVTVFDAVNQQIVRLHLPEPGQNEADWCDHLPASSEALAIAVQHCPNERFNLLKKEYEPTRTPTAS